MALDPQRVRAHKQALQADLAAALAPLPEDDRARVRRVVDALVETASVEASARGEMSAMRSMVARDFTLGQRGR